MIITLRDAAQFVGQEVTVRGWLHNKRSSGKIHFLQIRDGSDYIQGVAVAGELPDTVIEAIHSLTLESSLTVTGQLKEEPRSPSGYELLVTNLTIVHLNTEEYPIGKKEHGPDFLLNHRHLWLRSQKQWAIQRVRDTVIHGIYDFMRIKGFIKIDAPIFTPTSCEDTTELFEVDYFGNPVYLTQSGQLYIEAAIFSHGKVFDFGPVFRSEKSKTRRHLTEFWMMDAEMAFVEHQENMEIQEQLLYHVVQRVLTNNRRELAILERDVAALEAIRLPFIRMTHAEAVKLLHELGSSIDPNDDLGAEDETILTKAHDNCMFIEKYPFAVKAFYMKKDPEDPSRALCADLLAPEGYGEIFGGSQREDSYEELLKEIRAHNLNEADFQWYLDLRRYGSVPHSGFGLGLERIVGWLSGIHHIRETIPFPRMIHRIHP